MIQASRSAIRVLSLSALSIVLVGPSISACSRANSDSGHAELSRQLAAIQSQLGTTNREIEALSNSVSRIESDLAELEANSVACTLDRFLADECGEYNQPFSLEISLCSTRGAEAQVAADFAVNNTNSADLGLGYEVTPVTGQIVRNVEFPGIPGLGVTGAAVLKSPAWFLYGLPFPNLSAGVGATGGLSLDGCISIPVLVDDVSREDVVTLMTRLQNEGQALQKKMREMADSALEMSAERITRGLEAMEVVQSKALSEERDIGLDDPLKIFERGRAYGSLLEVLPIGDKVQEVLDDPGLMVRALSQDIDDGTRFSRDAACDYFQTDGPELLRAATFNGCAPVKESLRFGNINDYLRKINLIPTREQIRDEICRVVDGVIASECSG